MIEHLMSTDSTRRQLQAFDALRRLTARAMPGAVLTEWVPAWSSKQLEETLDSILSASEGAVGDVLHALWTLGGQSDVRLTKPLAQFIQDVVVSCFTRYRARFEKEDFRWMTRELNSAATPAQAYVALLSLPESQAAGARDAILTSLKGSEFSEAAERML
jgi:hypothetical protein